MELRRGKKDAFQSHAGSIEASCPGWPGSPGRSRFNPTLVRLRHNGVDQGLVCDVRFNPTLVRLRPACPSELPLRDAVFQSHAGSIEARTKTFQPSLVITCFNPTLVRLRRPGSSRASFPAIPFQSHAGSIEAPPGPAGRAEAGAGFNPTLVRLRPAVLDFIAGQLDRGFNPTLVRLRLSIDTETTGLHWWVSIPRWFD